MYFVQLKQALSLVDLVSRRIILSASSRIYSALQNHTHHISTAINGLTHILAPTGFLSRSEDLQWAKWHWDQLVAEN